MKIGIIGITGRIGQVLVDLIEADPALTLSGGVSSKNNRADFENLAENSDVFVDFSCPAASIIAAEIARSIKIPFVCGTTGLPEDFFQKLKEFSADIPVLYASNFSLGVQLMAMLLEKCGKILDYYDVSIIDKHHSRKKDAPSGTALFLSEKLKKQPQVVSIRAGNVFGDHICDFTGEDEMLSISHRAFNRNIFAKGALLCAKWIEGKAPGMYSMQDCLKMQDCDDL